MRPVWFAFSAAGDGKPLLIDRDTILATVVATGLLVVASDPSATVANVTQTPAATGQLNGIIYAQSLNAFGSAQVNFELSKGDTIFLSKSGPGGILLLFDDGNFDLSQLG